MLESQAATVDEQAPDVGAIEYNRPVGKRAELNLWQRRALRLGACVVGGFAAAVPLALAYGTAHAEVHDDIAAVPATLSLAPGHSMLDLGPGGKVYNQRLVSQGKGVNLKLDGPPEILSNLNNIDSRQLHQSIKVMTGFFQDSKATTEGYSQAMKQALYDEVLSTELIAGSALAAAALLLTSLSTKELSARQLKTSTVKTIGILAILSTGSSIAVNQSWEAHNQLPETTEVIASLDGTPFEGSVADNPALATAISGVKPFVEKEVSREKEADQKFLSQAYQTINEQLAEGKFIAPQAGETAFLALSDLHSNQDMIKVYQYLVDKINEKYGKNTISFDVLPGDPTYGSAAEKNAVDEMAKIAKTYAIDGNHAGPLTISQMKSAGITVLNGNTVTTKSGITVLGGSDPHLTKLTGLFGSESDLSRDGSGETEAEAGKKVLAAAEKSHPTDLMVHEGYELAPIIAKDDISKATMEQWFDAGLSDEGFAGDDVPNLPASIIEYGHWHDSFKYRVISNDDGSWSVVAELGTAGGAFGSMSFPTKFSLPWTVPGKEASAVIMTVNDKSQLAVSLQELNTEVDGNFVAQPSTPIGSPDGQPYPVEVDTATTETGKSARLEALRSADDKHAARTRKNTKN